MHPTFPICFYAHGRRGPLLNFHPAPKVCKNIFPILPCYSLAGGRLSARPPFCFPVFRGVVFWQDFEQWRKQQNGLSNTAHERHAKPT
jgi:hypothetical protein